MAKKTTESVVTEEVVDVKVEPKKTTRKKSAEKTTEEKTAVKKTTTRTKKDVPASVVLQFSGQEVSMETVVQEIKKAFEAEGNQLSAIKDFQVYVKPEDNAAYYVINQDITGKVNLF